MDVFQGFEANSTTVESCGFLIYGCSVETNDFDLISQFQKRAAPLYFTLPDQQRLQAVRAYCFSGYDSPHPDAEVFRFLFREDKILQPMDLQTSLHDGYSLIHSAAIAFGRANRSIQTAILKSKVNQLAWKPLIRQIVSWARKANLLHLVELVGHSYSICTPDLVSAEEWIGTPLLSLLKGCLIDEYRGGTTGICSVRKLFKEHELVMQRTLREWLVVLAWCGVDLAHYGQQEVDFFASNPLSFKFKVSYSRRRLVQEDLLKEALLIRLCRLECGNAPEDWHLHWVVDIDGDRLAGDFWRTVEQESKEFRSMPGMWPG